jgi:diguanylate cyclase (GGDEF)-like protein
MAFGLVWILVLTEITNPPASTNWVAYSVAAIALLVCERSPAAWIRFGPIGIVTPLWLFAYAMLLFGSPSMTVGIAAVGATLHALRQESPVGDTVTRVASISLSISVAGLVLTTFDRGTLSAAGSQSWNWAGTVAMAGALIIVLNAFSAAIWLSARRRASFMTLMRHGLASRVTAEGALLSLAPLWVIGIDFNPVVIPILGITTILVFRSTRQALEQAHEARHDQLTGLLNRRTFLDVVGEALQARAGDGTIVLLMDLNGFKDINDRLGHQMGDTLLVAFADRLESGRPADAAAARLGGDEFAVVIRNHRGDVEPLVAALHEHLTRPLALDGFPVTAGVSIGVARAPVDGMTTTDLIKAADIAMYKAKRTQTAFELYANCNRAPQHGRVNLLADLGDAVVHHQLHIHYQPQLRIGDGAVDTLEVLVRWQHPVHGIIPPSEFIGLAEQTDLIGPITDMVLRTSTQGLMAGGLMTRLAVNISPRSLEEPDFTDRVFAILAESNFPPEQLELEVTERALVRNPERTRYTIGKLRAAGVRIAIDDFGVGYSSYQTLRTLDVDRVKIDRDFVQGVLASDRDRIIVASLVELAHDLGLDVVAEGVEGPHVWDALASLRCDVAQGYGIAVPMSYQDMRAWVTQWTAFNRDSPPRDGTPGSASLAS